MKLTPYKVHLSPNDALHIQRAFGRTGKGPLWPLSFQMLADEKADPLVNLILTCLPVENPESSIWDNRRKTHG